MSRLDVICKLSRLLRLNIAIATLVQAGLAAGAWMLGREAGILCTFMFVLGAATNLMSALMGGANATLNTLVEVRRAAAELCDCAECRAIKEKLNGRTTSG